MAMWVDLIVKPIRERDGQMLLWFDNCGCHVTDVIEQKFDDEQIDVAKLPLNMTGLLNVLDLAVNGPLKARVRNLRAKRMVDAFRVYKDKYYAQWRTGISAGEFKPPKPQLYKSIQDLFGLFREEFLEISFQKGVARCFQKTGTCPIGVDDRGAAVLNRYLEKEVGGIMKTAPEGTLEVWDNHALPDTLPGSATSEEDSVQ
jgi:hypothetical protein